MRNVSQQTGEAVKLPRVWITEKLIYADLGDGVVNFSSLDHMVEVLEVYRGVLKKGSREGSATFTPEAIVECRRRFFNLVNCIKQVKEMQNAT